MSDVCPVLDDLFGCTLEQEVDTSQRGARELGIISMNDIDTSVCPSVVCVLAHTSESDELEDDDDEESLELSDAMPVDSCRSTLSASAARSGLSCFKILEQPRGQNPVRVQPN